MFVLEYYDEQVERWEEIEQYEERPKAIGAYVKVRCEIDRAFRYTEPPKIRLRRAGSVNSIANNGYAGGR